MTTATPNPSELGGTNRPYEAQTQTIGQQLFNATRASRSFLSQVREQMRWDDKILAWTMANAQLRVQLFHLIDCLPALRSKAEIARHLREYLGHSQVELPTALKSLLNFSQLDSLPAQVAATTLATAVETLAHRYIAGANPPQLLKTLERLRKDHLSFTVDLLGEAVITEAEAQSYLERGLELIDQLTTATAHWPVSNPDSEHPLANVQLSVKLTAFYSQFSPLDAQGSQAKVMERVRRLLRHAETQGAAVHFDMEQYAYKDLTLSILKTLLMEEEFRQRSDVGLTLQAYLQDSSSDLQDLIDWAKQRGTPITVRLVKGAYWDQETINAIQKGWPHPVFQDKAATDANFEHLTQILLEHHEYLHSAIGSHNIRSQAHALAIAQALDIPQQRIEFQVLYGMGDQLAKAIAQQGYRVRVYCPYGELIPGMSYLIRRLLENTANSSFLRQNLSDRPIAELLAAPIVTPSPQAEMNGGTAFLNAPDADYADVANRDRIQQALQTVRQQFGRLYRPWIGGEFVETDTTVDSINPSRITESVGKVGLISLEQAEQAMTAAQNSFSTWRQTSVADRAAILRKAATLMSQQRDELIAWIVFETGKPIQEADGEVSEAIDFCRYYADGMEQLDRGSDYNLPGETNHYRYQPLGIVLVISPWNFPLAIPTGMVVAALVAGNCVLLKPAETAAIVAAKLTDILIAAGMPQGVFQFIPGSGATIGAHLVKHPQVQMIAFTGSQAVGCQIYRDAAILQPGQRHLKRVVAEMGGKNAIIVDESADLDQAVQGVVASAFGYSGQKCSACSRVIVLEPIYETFLQRLVEATRSLSIGTADLPATRIGPVIDPTAQRRIQAAIEQGRSQAEVALELPVPAEGCYVSPVIFTQVDLHSKLAQTEIFGPVLAVLRADCFTNALTIANATPYALTGGLYSRTPSHIQQAQAEFEVGNLYINRGITGAIVARQPFGGFKLSGVGTKAGGPDYLLQFLSPRVITENIQRQGFAPIGEDDPP